MKTVAILGPTASGKTDLSIRLATRFDAAILSLDSLAIYREIDIASAKPTPMERGNIPHFGIDVINPDKHFSVSTFIGLYRQAEAYCRAQEKNLIIVGGTGFYLKTLMEGISEVPDVSKETKAHVSEILLDLPKAYDTLYKIDPIFFDSVSPTDRYRIEKGLQLYYETGTPPTRYFAENPPMPILQNVPLFEIGIERELLHRRIEKRTEKMIETGLVDEVARLEKRYGRKPNPMKAIGIIEVLDYLDGKVSFSEMKERIVIHTRQLAKRQKTFNATQFPPHYKGSAENVETEVSKVFER